MEPASRGSVVQATRVLVVLLFSFTAVRPVLAQELEPRAYSASPVGALFLVASASRASGTVVVDSSLPVDDVSATRTFAIIGLGYTFDLFDKVALVTGLAPYAWADVAASVAGQTRSVSRSGLADSRVKLSVNLVGNPAMGAREFARAPRRTVAGVSLTAAAPTGAYDGTQLVNIGTNRWSYKPEAGISVPVGRWDLDAYAGVWIFAINDEFFPGAFTRLQDPLVTVQGHAECTFRPQLWVAANGTWYAGGESHIEGRNPGPRMNNSRLGVTVSLPVAARQSIKIAYSMGASVRVGPNFRALSVGWQTVWLTKP